MFFVYIAIILQRYAFISDYRTFYSYFNEKPNLFKVLCEGVYLYIVKPYILYKLNGNESENAANSEKTLLKYKMETNPSNYFQWFKS